MIQTIIDLGQMGLIIWIISMCYRLDIRTEYLIKGADTSEDTNRG